MRGQGFPSSVGPAGGMNARPGSEEITCLSSQTDETFYFGEPRQEIPQFCSITHFSLYYVSRPEDSFSHSKRQFLMSKANPPHPVLHGAEMGSKEVWSPFFGSVLYLGPIPKMSSASRQEKKRVWFIYGFHMDPFNHL